MPEPKVKMNSAERIESLKAGTVGALSVSLAFLIASLSNSWVLAERFEGLAELQMTTGINWLVSGAIAFLSGFLFGVTYRYVIRDDENPHLKTGTVLAFGLVRGLAQLDIGLNLTDTFWSLGILGVESIFCFAIACFTLEWAIHQYWVKPFKST